MRTVSKYYRTQIRLPRQINVIVLISSSVEVTLTLLLGWVAADENSPVRLRLQHAVTYQRQNETQIWKYDRKL